MRVLSLLVLLFLPLVATAQPSNDVDFLDGLSDFHNVSQALPEWLNRQAFDFLDQRRQKIEALRTPADVAARKKYIRETMLRMLGGLPDRTPLNAQITGTIEREGYRIEKVLFESRPGFYVTGNLYVPTRGTPPYPAVLYPLGHERGGKSYPVWQQMLGALALKGYIAFTWDPLAQGERKQFWDSELGGSKVGRSTTEHTMLGIQCILLGDNVAQYTIWDGIRALDYLLSRPESDPTRVACTGNSGGGTHTAYLSALDDRIDVAAPSCYITSWRRLLMTIGPQDAEQCLLPFVGAGLDHPDFIHAFAPKPYLILSAIRDFFSIKGARSTFSEAKQIYGLHRADTKIDMVEADDGHGYSKPRRLAAYRWFAQWLKKDEEDDGSEPEVAIASARELSVTSTGQVATSVGGETVSSLNRKRLHAILAEGRGLPDPVNPKSLDAYRRTIRRRVRERTGYTAPGSVPKVASFGEAERENYLMEKLVIEPEPGVVVPAVLFLPSASGRKPAVIYAHEDGKSAEAGPAGNIERLVEQGNAVLAVDLRGLGETAGPDARSGSEFGTHFGSYDNPMTSFLIGKTMVGMRTLDVIRCADVLEARDDIDAGAISAVGVGAAAIPVLHAAVLDERIQSLTLRRMMLSYQAAAESPIHRGILESVVPGVLRAYDLPQLLAALAPRRVRIEQPLDPTGNGVRKASAEAAYAAARRAYEASRAADAFRIE